MALDAPEVYQNYVTMQSGKIVLCVRLGKSIYV